MKIGKGREDEAERGEEEDKESRVGDRWRLPISCDGMVTCHERVSSWAVDRCDRQQAGRQLGRKRRPVPPPGIVTVHSFMNLPDIPYDPWEARPGGMRKVLLFHSLTFYVNESVQYVHIY